MHYGDLRIFKLSAELRDELYKELSQIQFGWKIEDIKQALRSSSSISSNIVEGYSRRFYPKDFVHFLNISLGSSDETQNHISALGQKGLLSQEKAAYFLNRYKTLSIQTLNFFNYWRKKIQPLSQPSGPQ